MHVRSIGIVGHGAFGALMAALITRFAPGVAVRIFSSRHAPDGKTFFSLADTAQCDAVVLTVPISAFEGVVQELLPLTRQGTVLVDVSTVKVHTVSILKRLAAGRQWIATHPMWGPESYEKRGGDVSGFRIVMADRTIAPDEFTRLKTFFADIGFDVVEMTAEQHDKHLAETLFLTHYIGQIVHRAGFDRTAIDTVSFGFLMDAVESVKHDARLFKDVFTYNPYCKDVLNRFELKEAEVRKLLEST